MTVILRRNSELDLSLIEYRGSVSFTELKALAAYQAANVESLKRDALNLVLPGADFSSIDFAAIDALYARYRSLFRPLDMQIYRRVAWICRSEAARRHVDHWLSGRDMRQSLSSDTRAFDDVASAGDWLVLTEQECAAVERGEGFAEIARFHSPPAAVAR